MATSIWIRNPDRALSALVKQNVTRITWTRQHLMRLGNDGISLVRNFYLASPLRPKIMIIGIQGASEYDLFDSFDKPKAVYPVWSGEGDDVKTLRRYIENPWGEDRKMCDDDMIPPALRPTLGQKHRIIIHNTPNPVSGVGKKFFLEIAQLQEDNPDIEFFINGTNSFAVLFGLNFKAGDFGLSDAGDINDRIQMPNGMRIHLKQDWKRIEQYMDWFSVVGFTPKEVLSSQERRYEFRIAAVNWASKYWNENFRFYTRQKNVKVDFDSPDNSFTAPQSTRIVLRPKQFTLKEADKILCARCRISPGCRFYREDSVCGIGDSDMSELAKFFGSRNASRIVDGLAAIVQMQAKRLENRMEQEEVSGEPDPEVSKEINSLFSNGVKLAKLVDPNLAGPGTKVQVNVGVGAEAANRVLTADPKQMVASVMEALEAQGVPREEITPRMIQNTLAAMSGQSSAQAITAQAEAHSTMTASQLADQIAQRDAFDAEFEVTGE